MPETDQQICSRCGFPVSPDMKCYICSKPLCPYEIRMLDGLMLCPRCYKEETFQYHSKKCDIIGH
jgi:ribosomal protein L37E